MIIVGIDIAKNKHDAIIIDSKGDALTKSFTILNSHKGTDTLINKIKVINSNNLPVIIGMEATGHYWLSLYSRLIQEDFEINVINPI